VAADADADQPRVTMIARRSVLRFVPSLALAAPLVFGLAACTYDNHNSHCMDNCGGQGGYTNPPPPDNSVPESTIDTGATLGDVQAGEGAGSFVEYAGDGRWHVFTACDTKLSGASCNWDIIVSVDSGNAISDFQPETLEENDSIDWYDKLQSLHFIAENSNDFDGFYFDATAGQTVRVDVYLDGSPAPRFIYWVGDGGVHSGAPSNPVDLTPSAP
jgi:hypothetical protein